MVRYTTKAKPTKKRRLAMVRESGLAVEETPPKARKAMPPPVAALRTAS